MVEKPTSGDEEQRRAQTRAARKQSGLPPEPDDGGAQDAPGDSGHQDAGDDGGTDDTGANPASQQDR
jgi:hypothetical protein